MTLHGLTIFGIGVVTGFCIGLGLATIWLMYSNYKQLPKND